MSHIIDFDFYRRFKIILPLDQQELCHRIELQEARVHKRRTRKKRI